MTRIIEALKLSLRSSERRKLKPNAMSDRRLYLRNSRLLHLCVAWHNSESKYQRYDCKMYKFLACALVSFKLKANKASFNFYLFIFPGVQNKTFYSYLSKHNLSSKRKVKNCSNRSYSIIFLIFFLKSGFSTIWVYHQWYFQ